MSIFRKIFKRDRPIGLSDEELREKRLKKLPLLLGLIIYLMLPMICIISAGIFYELHSDPTPSPIIQPIETSWLGFFFTPPPVQIAPVQQLQCPRSLHIWLFVAGILFLFNVPIVYLYQIQQKFQKKKEKGLMLRLKNSITTHTKKTLFCTTVCMALIVQPLNFSWAIVGFSWLFSVIRQQAQTQKVSCVPYLTTLSIIQCTVAFFSVFLHIHLIFQVVATLKSAKKIDQQLIPELSTPKSPKFFE